MPDTSLTGLNPAQQEAVTAESPIVRVLAGAGSGKTRVLVHRFAWLVERHYLSPGAIMAVTFTNKAAHEMRHRIEQLVSTSMKNVWVGTFHGLAHRLLRRHWAEAKLLQNFQIIDSDDQQRLLRQIIRSLDLDDKVWSARQAAWLINHYKDQGLRARHIMPDDENHARWLQIYRTYEQRCQQSGLVDFGELLLSCYQCLREHPTLLTHYQQRFQQILVDEFQDTNTIQYAWIRLLIGEHNQLFVVGDDDQSIYSFRGAKVENIQQLDRDFSHVETVRLEQNYRSTGTILAAANALIGHNQDRLGKKLWTADDQGPLIQCYAAHNEYDEARFVAERLEMQIHAGVAADQIAILYRSNVQSRVLEQTLQGMAIAYRVYGGLRFYDRVEIKDAMAYLRLMLNPHDDAAFERSVNQPPRGIGERTLSQLRQQVHQQNCSLWQAAESLLMDKKLTARASRSLQGFLSLIHELGQNTLDLPQQIDALLVSSGLVAHYQKDKQKSEMRLDNLAELVTASRELAGQEEALRTFVDQATLDVGTYQAGKAAVQLMTLHASKGLEFNHVFLVGMEEGLFPSSQSVGSETKLEEERRLAYVGITRARRQLCLSFAERRNRYGEEQYPMPSRFIHEIPHNLRQDIRLDGNRHSLKYQAYPKSLPKSAHQHQSDNGYRLGQRVNHSRFGEGVIVAIEGSGKHLRLQINFVECGRKTLVAAYARLVPLSA